MEKSLGCDHRDRWTQHDLNWTHHFPSFLQICCGSVFLAFNLSPIRHPAARDTNLNVISGDAALPHPPPSLILHHSSLSLIYPPQDDCSCLQKMKLSGTSLFFLSRVSIFIFHLCLLQSILSGLFTLPSSRRLGVRSPSLYPFLPHVHHLHLYPISVLCLHAPSTLLFPASLSLTFSCSSLSYNVSFDAHASGHLPVPSPLVFCSGLLWLWFIPWAVY